MLQNSPSLEGAGGRSKQEPGKKHTKDNITF